MTGTGPGSWQPDPEGRYDYRWWDGQHWTDQISHQGQAGRAPMGGQPQGPQAQGGPPQPQGGAPQHQATAMGQPSGDGFAGITGDLVDGRFSEKEAKPIANQNAKLLRVRLGEPFMARQGSMVAYQGNVDFAFEGGGAGKFLKKALTGEGLPLMRCQGQGDVFLAERANDVHLLNLTNSGLSISGKNVLAFSSSLDWNIERVKGGSIATGGLFNTTLRGTGWVALTTDGPPVVLNAAEAPTFADTNAVVAWSANLQTQLKTSFKAGALIGRGSGEAVQVSFYGQGFVIVQPSEGMPQVATQ
ncbi:AIM24 family protein [Mycobacterium sp.]|uniref:AIM24 family protein n=1 Tax=Mycobacterium sp. TaxID=1785 RepID=UPI002D97296F|nr:AIM24 family protein [Mycobacterium sp.]